MHPTLQEIKKLRMQAGLTQSELANRAGVSQSLIAKIESGQLDPAFSKAMQILDTLHSLHQKQERDAEYYMNPKLIAVTAQEPIKSVIMKMKKFGISQLPVIEDQRAIGMIAESTILEALLHETKKDASVGEVMGEAPPLIPHTAKKKVLVELLALYPMVMVSKGGRLAGIITKADLISKLYS